MKLGGSIRTIRNLEGDWPLSSVFLTTSLAPGDGLSAIQIAIVSSDSLCLFNKFFVHDTHSRMMSLFNYFKIMEIDFLISSRNSNRCIDRSKINGIKKELSMNKVER
uniref:Uncharacterized protein n=1 Tax=Romanomermis culicivorax TaxID=13658 RepID=A0A915KM58_ROMCU